MNAIVLAAVDVGSSAARLSIVRMRDGRFEPLFFHRYPVRLGTGAFDPSGSRLLPEPLVEALLRAADDMCRRCQEYGVVETRAVATSAMREADNGADVARRFGEVLGSFLQVIDGDEEARLGRAAVVHALAEAGEALPKRALLLDLGGGSLELASADGRRRDSLPLGSVRLLSALPALRETARGGTLEALAARVQKKVDVAIDGSAFGDRAHWLGMPLLGTGGNLEVMARLLPRKAPAPPGIDLSRAGRLIRLLASLPVAERAARFGLRPERADLMLPALMILSSVGRRLGQLFVRVPGTGIRDALLRELGLKLSAASA
jgi:exopolyphosphatase/guanosine-5'-triphosphate,3'-diphosphate pyrophosphatase